MLWRNYVERLPVNICFLCCSAKRRGGSSVSPGLYRPKRRGRLQKSLGEVTPEQML
jgi:hypothetical protein